MSDSDLIFDGTGAIPSDAFIRSIRRQLLSDPNRGDDAYAAGVAASCLGGQALDWFINQPDEVQDSWRAMQRAILARWPSSGEGGSVDASIPTPAAAPSPAPAAAPPAQAPAASPPIPWSPPAMFKRQSSGSSTHNSRSSTLGKILIVPKDRTPQGYLGANLNGRGHYVITRSASEALVVELSGSSGRGREMMLQGKNARVGLVTSSSNERNLREQLMGRRSMFWASISTISAGSGRSSSKIFDGQTQTHLWDVSDDGALHLAWEARSGVWCDLNPILRLESSSLGVTNDLDVYEEKMGRSVTYTAVELFFEPI